MNTEDLDRVRHALFSLHGGVEKFDQWLTCTADRLVKEKEIPAVMLASFPNLPELPKPNGMVDFILEQLEAIGIWGYRIKREASALEVTELIYNHVIETIPYSEENLQSLFAKYGYPING